MRQKHSKNTKLQGVSPVLSKDKQRTDDLLHCSAKPNSALLWSTRLCLRAEAKAATTGARTNLGAQFAAV